MRTMEISASFVLCWIFFISALFPVHGLLKTGFISIDCGANVAYYYDLDTGISYNSDSSYIDTGINRNISAEYGYPNNPVLPLPISDVRSFPDGDKNCYTLVPGVSDGSLSLIRATFMYGNYDGKNELPEFDLYLDVNFWSSIKFKNASDVVVTEILSTSRPEGMNVCLLNKGVGTPFISALELRPVNNSIYTTEEGTETSLVLFERMDIGSSNGTGRYQDDAFDRIWSTYVSSSWTPLRTSLPININEDGYRAPLEVIQTAATPKNTSKPLEVYWNDSSPSSQFYIYLYFAEVDKLLRNQSRKFNISWNGSPFAGPFVPQYLVSATLSNSKAFVGSEHRVSIYNTEDSTLPPILNAVEIFRVRIKDQLPTYTDDVEAMMNIKSTYRVKKLWTGDPCKPENYSWEGLKCNYSISSPRIISLNLSSSHLTGVIVSSIAKLSSLESLDLSKNNLTGPVPEFLEELSLLKFLSLKGNQLSGSIPSSILQKAEAGLLSLSVDDRNLEEKKNKKIVPIVVPILIAVFVIAVLGIIWKLRRRSEANKKKGRLAPKKCQYTYAEILTITNNFQTMIGKGGFGSVYHGSMEDGTQVAVKMLSPSSSQGYREFQTEAELLMRIHHRNLAFFVGYCDEGDNMALIYEYMTNGNLKDYLSVANPTLSWEMRLRIALDAAQGLEYLHDGCKPPIIHRDVKSANILLSEKLDAKVADFGLSKAFPVDNHQTDVVTVVMGTTGYLDPEYYITQKLNERSDVYSFGIVLLELITAKPAVIKSDEPTHILHWVHPEIKQGNLQNIIDPRLEDGYDEDSVWRTLELAMACTTPTSINRATMSYVVAELRDCLAMELSSGREETAKLDEENFHSMQLKAYSMNAESMTGPSGR